MASEKTRTFEDKPAVRTSVPLLVGLTGASGSGKTYSALRLATGIQRATGGEIFYIDTEARRSLHYADEFKFRHLPFEAPFGPLDYLAAVDHCVKQGAKVLVIDSMSHEHEGPGGVLEKHEEETTRLAAAWKCSRDAAQMSAWAQPKAERRRFINTILQLGINGIFCFRAKEKIKISKGEKPRPMGWMPIAGEEFVFEMTVNCLLYPGCGGVPTWNPAEEGEKMMTKLPKQFQRLLSERRALDEQTGEAMAKWAAGGDTPSPVAAKPTNGSRTTALFSAMDAAGITRERRGEWLSTQAKRKIAKPADLTDEEIATMTAFANEIAAALPQSDSFG